MQILESESASATLERIGKSALARASVNVLSFSNPPQPKMTRSGFEGSVTESFVPQKSRDFVCACSGVTVEAGENSYSNFFDNLQRFDSGKTLEQVVRESSGARSQRSSRKIVREGLEN